MAWSNVVESLLTRRAEFVAKNPDLAFMLRPLEEIVGDHGLFVGSLAQGFNTYGSLTPKQCSSLRQTLTKAGKAGGAERAPVGETEIEATIESTQDREYRGQILTHMMARSDSGYRVWGALPVQMAAPQPGSRVRFTAIFAVKSDPYFAIAKGVKILSLEPPEITSQEVI